MKRFRQFAVLFSLLALVYTPLFAGDEADPPSRVARLNYVSGKISIQPGGVEDWVAASVNRPLTTYDRVWADKDSRAELNLGTAAIRINSETSLGLSNVSDNTVQLELFQGTLNLRVAHLYSGEIYEVDTPNMAFTVLKSGSYRFDVNADGDYTLVTVWKGEGEATGDGPGVRVHGDEMMRFTRNRSLVHIRSAAPARDGFDDWCRVRDRRQDGAGSLRYVARGTIGYEDLDGYGSWVYVAPYGYIWEPVVTVGWAPYRYGHWIWVSPWGWTWVDNEPWGFAPFHYGRWIYARNRWGWCPGPYSYGRPYYAPALVAWIGGSHWGVSIGFGGGVGWFPLGWGDPYFPYYRHSRGYFRNVNVYNTRITNITYITNNYYNNDRGPRWRYRNEQVNGAVTAVSRDTVINARRVDRDFVAVQRAQMRDASLLRNPDMRPERGSVLGPHAADATPRAVPDRAVVSRVTPPRERPQFDFNRDTARGNTARGDTARADTPRGDTPRGDTGRGAAANMEQRGAVNDRNPVVDRARGTPAQRAESPAAMDRVPNPGNRPSNINGSDTAARRDNPEPRQFRYPRPPVAGSSPMADAAVSRPGMRDQPGAVTDRGNRVPRPLEAGGVQPNRGPNVDRARGTQPDAVREPNVDRARGTQPDVVRAPNVDRARGSQPDAVREPNVDRARGGRSASVPSPAADNAQPSRPERDPAGRDAVTAPARPSRQETVPRPPQSSRNESNARPPSFGFTESRPAQPNRSYRPDVSSRPAAPELPSYRGAPARQTPSYAYREAPRAPAREMPSYRSAPSAPRSSGGGYRASPAGRTAPSANHPQGGSRGSSSSHEGTPRNH